MKCPLIIALSKQFEWSTQIFVLVSVVEVLSLFVLEVVFHGFWDEVVGVSLSKEFVGILRLSEIFSQVEWSLNIRSGEQLGDFLGNLPEVLVDASWKILVKAHLFLRVFVGDGLKVSSNNLWHDLVVLSQVPWESLVMLVLEVFLDILGGVFEVLSDAEGKFFQVGWDFLFFLKIIVLDFTWDVHEVFSDVAWDIFIVFLQILAVELVFVVEVFLDVLGEIAGFHTIERSS